MIIRPETVHQALFNRIERRTRGWTNETGLSSGPHRAQSHLKPGEPLLKKVVRLVLTVFLMFCIAAPGASGQDFPYAVPQAPEFDEQGKETPAARNPSQSQKPAYHAPAPSPPRNQPAPQPIGGAPPAAPEYRQAQPYAPQEPPQQPSRRSKRRAQQQSEYADPPGAPQLQPQQNLRPDCSNYPMMIARAQSEPQMQDIARSYLTCLLQNGWQMDQARQQVITTIESTYRLTR